MMNRGRRGEEVFSGPEDFKHFIALLQGRGRKGSIHSPFVPSSFNIKTY